MGQTDFGRASLQTLTAPAERDAVRDVLGTGSDAGDANWKGRVGHRDAE